MSEKYQNKYSIKSNRLQGFDYSSDGVYFITICTAKHICEFGEIVNDTMILNEFGRIIKNEWKRYEEIREEISLGDYCIMPNHIHAIVYIGDGKVL